ncbi:hypothetical protein [Lysobacter enzymogenes]|uniref:hypothetical protein n=1 Tax=Lysobacter enzymogenes TaxID=69 RepID=UPI001AF1AFC3|nr:hypothetical protein [Lysobacter enzymogenes]QQQ02899.1 hypothetical protein JHW41_08040 [Lysobacter enzymogenes]
MKAANWVQDTFRALPRYLFVLTAVSALALLARAAVPSFSRASAADSESLVSELRGPPRELVAPAAAPAAALTIAAASGSRLVAQARLPEPVRSRSPTPAHRYSPVESQLKRTRGSD